jgi:hypothetical protein
MIFRKVTVEQFVAILAQSINPLKRPSIKFLMERAMPSRPSIDQFTAHSFPPPKSLVPNSFHQGLMSPLFA